MRSLQKTAAALMAAVAVAGSARAETAEEILTSAGARDGLVVHVGCGRGELTARLAGDGRFVHGLDSDPGNVAKAREALGATDRAGAAAFAVYDGRHLPYVENLVNLLVADGGLGDVPMAEVLRVLAPRGVAYVKAGGKWTRTVKPVPDAIDDWPHYLHGPDNNAVARDSIVGPPRHTQWVGGPAFSRSHEINSSMAAMVSAGGRLFYIWDEGPTAITHNRLPPKWRLIARDAFNGAILWKRPMPEWGWRQWHAEGRWDDPRERAKMLRHLPSTLPRRLVGAEDRVFVTLGYAAPVTVLDAATGEVLRELKGTAPTDELLYSEGVLVLRVRTADSPPERDVWNKLSEPARGRVMVVDPESGEVRWRGEPDEMAPLTLAARNGRVYYYDYERIVCLSLKDGRELWRTEPVAARTGHRGTAGTLVARDDEVLLATYPGRGESGHLYAFSAETGKVLWKGPKHAGPGITNPPDLFVAGGLVWAGERPQKDVWAKTELRREGYDPATGKPQREVVVPKLISWGHHYRCYRSKATERFLLLPKRGVEFVDLAGSDHMRNDWLRAPCIYGMLPTNGLLYVAPHPCVCYQGVLLSNFNALAGKAARTPAPEPAGRLRKGPAYGKAGGAGAGGPGPGDWPSYRHDGLRSGATPAAVAGIEGQRWSVQLREPLTPPVVAGGRALVAEIDAHTLHALDAETGERRWRYVAGGRIDSPPTVHGPRVLLGSNDGMVTCLRLADGEMVWQFLAAPGDRRVMAFGQVESAWPVPGSVLIQKDATQQPPGAVAYVSAGRSSFLDGGIRLYGLDPATGKVLHRQGLAGPWPDPMKDKGGAGYMDGSKADILVGDGADIYLFQERLRSDLTRDPAPMQKPAKEHGGFRVYPRAKDRGSSGKRIITTHGFRNGTDNEGKFWTYGDRWPGWSRHMGGVGPYGQLLSVDKDMLYGVHVFTESVRVRRGRHKGGGHGQRLFARGYKEKKDRWSQFVPVRVRGLVLAGKKLFFAGTPDVIPPDDPLAAIEGRRGAVLWAVSAKDGAKLAERKLPAPPIYDGLIAAGGRLLVSTTDGRLICLGE